MYLRLYLQKVENLVLEQEAVNLIIEWSEFENMCVRELMHIWKTKSKTTPEYAIL